MTENNCFQLNEQCVHVFQLYAEKYKQSTCSMGIILHLQSGIDDLNGNDHNLSNVIKSFKINNVFVIMLFKILQQ